MSDMEDKDDYKLMVKDVYYSKGGFIYMPMANWFAVWNWRSHMWINMKGDRGYVDESNMTGKWTVRKLKKNYNVNTTSNK